MKFTGLSLQPFRFKILNQYQINHGLMKKDANTYSHYLEILLTQLSKGQLVIFQMSICEIWVKIA